MPRSDKKTECSGEGGKRREKEKEKEKERWGTKDKEFSVTQTFSTVIALEGEKKAETDLLWKGDRVGGEVDLQFKNRPGPRVLTDNLE